MAEEAADVVQYLAQQSQLLAALHCLSNLQVLASIPLKHMVAIKDVADVSGVPYPQLLRLIRTTATAGVLHEPRPEYVEHTTLSAQFVKKPFLTDAVGFLNDIALPAALQMVPVTQHQAQMIDLTQSSYAPGTGSGLSLDAKCERHPRSRRQVAAYHRLRQNNFDDSVTETLSRLDWVSLKGATIVQVGSRSSTTAHALLAQNPDLHFIVQMADKESYDLATQVDTRVTIQYRARGDPQFAKASQVFILYLPGASLHCSHELVMAEIAAELQIHFDVLRANRQARLLLVAELLPEPGMAETKVEAAARSHDLFMMQLANGGLLDVTQLESLVTSVGDETGKFFVMNKVYSRRGPTVVLRVRVEDL